MIADEELRNIFKTASEEHLQKLEDGLLHLEKHPDDQARLEEVLREAHTLKGDSRMLGVDDVEALTHQLEETLGPVKRGESIFSAQICDRLCQGVDAIHKLVHEAVTGEPADVNVFSILAQLMGADTGSSAQNLENGSHDRSLFPDTITDSEFNVDSLFSDTTTKLPVLSDRATKPLPVPAPPALKIPAADASTQVGSNQIQTIRVEPQKLDTLMTQAGELTVTKTRIAHHTAEIQKIVTLWEEWSRDAYANRLAFNDVRGLHNGTLKQVEIFQQRAEKRLELLGVLVNRLKNAAYEDTARLGIVAGELESGIRTLRLLPLSTIFNHFPRMVRDLAHRQSKKVNLVIEGRETRLDKWILEEMRDPLMHMMRNAIDHGIETPQERQSLGKPGTATIRLRGYQTASNIVIEIVDDGRGLNIESIKQTALRRGVCREEELAAMTTAQIQLLIFASGFSTRTAITEISGRGVGLDVVRANVERLKGTVQVESTPGMGCTFRVQLNTTIATTHVLIVEVNSISYALPMEFVQTTLLVSQREIFAIEGCQTIALNGQPVSVAWLADLLELQLSAPVSPKAAGASKMLSCIILRVGEERLGLLVDALLDEQDVVLKPQSKFLKRIRNVSGATILSTGEVCMILNPQDLLNSVQKRTVSVTSETVEEEQRRSAILLVEDSITIRTQVKRILEKAGYEVVTAVDGLDGFNKLRTHTFDAVVSDVQMPNLDGLSLTAKIRQHQEYRELPIVLCTTLATDEDKRRGAEAGANAYLTKGTFDQNVLLNTLRRLV